MWNAVDAAVAWQLLINVDHIQREQDQAQDQGDEQQPGPVRRRQQARRRFWTRPWNSAQERLNHGDFFQLLEVCRHEDQEAFANYLRLPVAMYDEVLTRIQPRIQGQSTSLRQALDPGLKLSVTLRHLATGNSYASLAFAFRIAKSTVVGIIPEVCDAIKDAYAEEVMSLPSDAGTWLEIAEEFRRRWNVPHALGALDGKHIAIKKPPNTGSTYFNYKGFFSVVLMALVDADYKFLYTDVGGVGHQSDAQIFNASELRDAIEDGSLDLPDPAPMPNDDQDMPYFLLGDDAFALQTWLMKPYARTRLEKSKRIYNYRISRARRVVENAFGILANRFRVFLTTMQQKPQVVMKIVHAGVCLHNLMRLRYPAGQNAALDREDQDHQLVPGAWRDGYNLQPLNPAGAPGRQYQVACQQRQYLETYFNSPAGSVTWQDNMI